MNRESETAVPDPSWQQNYEFIPAHELLDDSNKGDNVQDTSGLSAAVTTQQTGENNNLLTKSVQVERAVTGKENGSKTDPTIQGTSSSDILKILATGGVVSRPISMPCQIQQIEKNGKPYFVIPIWNTNLVYVTQSSPVSSNVMYVPKTSLPANNASRAPQKPSPSNLLHSPPSNSVAPCSKSIPKLRVIDDAATGDSTTVVLKTEPKDPSDAYKKPQHAKRKSGRDQDALPNLWKSQSQTKFEGAKDTDCNFQDERMTAQTVVDKNANDVNVPKSSSPPLINDVRRVPEVPPPTNSAALRPSPKWTDDTGGVNATVVVKTEPIDPSDAYSGDNNATVVIKTEPKDPGDAHKEPRHAKRKSGHHDPFTGMQDAGPYLWKSQSQPEFEGFLDMDFNNERITGLTGGENANVNDGGYVEDAGEDEEEEEDEEEDDLEMEDDSDDEDYVPDFDITVSKQKKKQRASTLRRRTLKVEDGPTESPRNDAEADENPSSDPCEESDHMQDERDSTDYSYSSEDSDEIERREKQRAARKPRRSRDPKWRIPSIPRQEIRLSRLPTMYECKICQERLSEADEIRSHYAELHPKEDTDPVVPGDAMGVQPLLAEIATELKQCNKCQEYVDNIKTHHRVHRTKFECEACGKVYTRKSTLVRHKNLHRENRQMFECTKCKKSYVLETSLIMHMQKAHGDSNKEALMCEYCGKQYRSQQSLSTHKLIHLEEKPFKCSECGRGFSQKSNMNLHMRMHTGARPYKCNVCEKAFNHNISLKTHQKKAHGIDWWKDNKLTAPS